MDFTHLSPFFQSALRVKRAGRKPDKSGGPFAGILILFLFLPIISQAQLHIFASYESVTAPFWDPINQDESRLLNNGYGLGAGYLWKLGDAEAVAIGPVIRYGKFTVSNLQNAVATVSLSGLQLNTRLYPGKLLLTCDCEELKNRVYTEGLIGWHYIGMETQAPEEIELVQDKSLSLGLGIGFHFPVGKQLVLNPIMRFNSMPEVNWEGLDRFSAPGPNPYFRTNTDLQIFQIELQITFISLDK
ncbi:MAG: hypothetical protein GYB31_09915 [Bacteroidetes bacterium]|nr:hypothetical protein [Bacteroidota bacterium]